MLTPREAFKVGFLHCCAKEGLTPEEMLTRVHSARTKLAGLTDLVTAPVGALKSLGSGALTGGLLSSLALGGLGGYAAAQATDADDVDVAAVRQRDLAAQLRQLTKQLRLKSELTKKRKEQPRPYSRI